MRLLVGIDDTDNKDSRGTGFKSRLLGLLIEESKLGKVNGITRHQLFVHESIAYTSQNSSACLDVDTIQEEKIKFFCAQFLRKEAADGSDAGLCITKWESISGEVQEWGRRAKNEVLNLNEARLLAEKNKIYLEGFTGTLIGQIGALAAIGLRKSGNDGRFIWLHGTRELRDFDAGIYTGEELKLKAGINKVQTENGLLIKDNDRIFCDGWTRPVLLNNCSVLLVEKINFVNYEWKTIAKEHIRSIS